jgi:hypothetical protein
MSSQWDDSSHGTAFGSAEPDATNVSKSSFIPKPLRARKKVYDPSLTAGMGPPDNDMTSGAPCVDATKERALSEKEQKERATAINLLTAKLVKFRERSSPTAAMMKRQPEVFAKQWESDIWKRSIECSDGVDYKDQVSATLRMLTKCDNKWSEGWTLKDGSDWTGEECFVWEIDKLHYYLLENEGNTSGSHTEDTSANLDYVRTQCDSAAEVTEDMLNANKHQEGLSQEAQMRKNNRRDFRRHIRDIGDLLGPADQMPSIDIVVLAASWETSMWTASYEHNDRIASYNGNVDELNDDLDLWRE